MGKTEGKKAPDTKSPVEPQSKDQIIAAIKKLGGKVTFKDNNPDKPIVGVGLDNTKVTNAWLVHLKGLTWLNLSRTKVRCRKTLFPYRDNRSEEKQTMTPTLFPTTISVSLRYFCRESDKPEPVSERMTGSTPNFSSVKEITFSI
jgi:hypothetical protein